MTKKATPLIFDFLKINFTPDSLSQLEELLKDYNSRVDEWDKIDSNQFGSLFSKTLIQRYFKEKGISLHGIKDHCELISIYLENLKKEISDLVKNSISNSKSPKKNPITYDFQGLGTLHYNNLLGGMFLVWSSPPKDFYAFLMRDFVSFYQIDRHIFKKVTPCKHCKDYFYKTDSRMHFCSSKCQQAFRNKDDVKTGKNALRMKKEKNNPRSARYKGKRKDHR